MKKYIKLSAALSIIAITTSFGQSNNLTPATLLQYVYETNGVFYPLYAKPIQGGSNSSGGSGVTYSYNGRSYTAIDQSTPEAGWHATLDQVFLQARIDGQGSLANMINGYNRATGSNYTPGGGTNGLFATLGVTNEAGMISLLGYPNEASMLTAYGAPDFTSMAAWMGYYDATKQMFMWNGATNTASLATALGYPNINSTYAANNVTNLAGLASVLGYNNDGGSVPQAQAFFTGIGGTNGIINMLATTDQVANSTIPPTTDAQRASLINALSTGAINASDLINLTSRQGGIATSTNTVFQEAAIAALTTAGNTSSTQNLYAALINNGATVNYSLWDPSLTHSVAIPSTLISSSDLTILQLNAAAAKGSSLGSGEDASWGSVNLTGFTAAGAQIITGNFSGTQNFVGSMLNGATIVGGDFSGLNMSGYTAAHSYLGDANFTGVSNLNLNNLVKAYSINGTINLTGTGVTMAQLNTAAAAKPFNGGATTFQQLFQNAVVVGAP